MATYSKRLRPTGNPFGLNALLDNLRSKILPGRASVFGLLIPMALIAFEIFNYSTTEFALADMIGDLNFSGIRWSTILALAFCGMDFAGIARLFGPEKAHKGAMASWYLLGAWLLAATMNATLTWWAVSAALLRHEGLGNEIVDRETLLSTVPVFVAILVWLIRVLMIGSFTLAGSRPEDGRGEFSQEMPPVRSSLESHADSPAEINHRNPARVRTPANGRRINPAPKPTKGHSQPWDQA